MRFSPGKILLLTACFLAMSSFGWGDVINFSNLPDNGTAVPDGYAGFNWHNLYDMSMQGMLDPANLASPTNRFSFAFNHPGSASAFSVPSGTFSFASAWLQSMGGGDMVLQVQGILHGALVDSRLIMLAGGSPGQLETFNWSGVNEVRFVPIAAASSGTNLAFLVTDLVVNTPIPEPATLLLMGSSIGLVFTQIRKKYRKD